MYAVILGTTGRVLYRGDDIKQARAAARGERFAFAYVNGQSVNKHTFK